MKKFRYSGLFTLDDIDVMKKNNYPINIEPSHTLEYKLYRRQVPELDKWIRKNLDGAVIIHLYDWQIMSLDCVTLNFSSGNDLMMFSMRFT